MSWMVIGAGVMVALQGVCSFSELAVVYGVHVEQVGPTRRGFTGPLPLAPQVRRCPGNQLVICV